MISYLTSSLLLLVDASISISMLPYSTSWKLRLTVNITQMHAKFHKFRVPEQSVTICITYYVANKGKQESDLEEKTKERSFVNFFLPPLNSRKIPKNV